MPTFLTLSCATPPNTVPSDHIRSLCTLICPAFVHELLALPRMHCIIFLLKFCSSLSFSITSMGKWSLTSHGIKFSFVCTAYQWGKHSAICFHSVVPIKHILWARNCARDWGFKGIRGLVAGHDLSSEKCITEKGIKCSESYELKSGNLVLKRLQWKLQWDTTTTTFPTRSLSRLETSSTII